MFSLKNILWEGWRKGGMNFKENWKCETAFLIFKINYRYLTIIAKQQIIFLASEIQKSIIFCRKVRFHSKIADLFSVAYSLWFWLLWNLSKMCFYLVTMSWKENSGREYTKKHNWRRHWGKLKTAAIPSFSSSFIYTPTSHTLRHWHVCIFASLSLGRRQTTTCRNERILWE